MTKLGRQIIKSLRGGRKYGYVGITIDRRVFSLGIIYLIIVADIFKFWCHKCSIDLWKISTVFWSKMQLLGNNFQEIGIWLNRRFKSHVLSSLKMAFFRRGLVIKWVVIKFNLYISVCMSVKYVALIVGLITMWETSFLRTTEIATTEV